jgi:hypothetical protein
MAEAGGDVELGGHLDRHLGWRVEQRLQLAFQDISVDLDGELAALGAPAIENDVFINSENRRLGAGAEDGSAALVRVQAPGQRHTDLIRAGMLVAEGHVSAVLHVTDRQRAEPEDIETRREAT